MRLQPSISAIRSIAGTPVRKNAPSNDDRNGLTYKTNRPKVHQRWKLGNKTGASGWLRGSRMVVRASAGPVGARFLEFPADGKAAGNEAYTRSAHGHLEGRGAGSGTSPCRRIPFEGVQGGGEENADDCLDLFCAVRTCMMGRSQDAKGVCRYADAHVLCRAPASRAFCASLKANVFPLVMVCTSLSASRCGGVSLQQDIDHNETRITVSTDTAALRRK